MAYVCMCPHTGVCVVYRVLTQGSRLGASGGVQLAFGLLSKRLDALSPLDDGVGFGGERQRPDSDYHTLVVSPIFRICNGGVRG